MMFIKFFFTKLVVGIQDTYLLFSGQERHSRA